MAVVMVVATGDSNDCPEDKRGVFLHSTDLCTCVKYREMVILMFDKTSEYR
jgi:hypothetical protein